MKLIINADDFGFSEGVTYGIYDAIKRGVVTSTTMMVTARAARIAARLTRENDDLAVGLHLNISLGKPLTNCESLLRNGSFVKPKQEDIHESYLACDLDSEFEAQYEEFCSLCGKMPTHVDSHLYTHQLYKNVEAAAIRLCERHGLPLRDAATKDYERVAFDGRFKLAKGETTELLARKFEETVSDHLGRDEILEMLAHPAFIDEYVLLNSSYNLQRVSEHAVLTSESTRAFLQDNGIMPTNYKFGNGKQNG